MKILVSCLETSANLHLKQVLERLGSVEIFGIFDKEFLGLESPGLYDSKEFSAMGFVEILPLIFKAKRALKQMLELARNCDKILLIDSPAFNIPLAKMIKKAGINKEIIYYILPQVWAWRPSRVKQIEANCDTLASILPFEKQFYKKSIYVGHPLLDEINSQKTKLSDNKIIAFLPGSRSSEISRLMPIYKSLALRLSSKKLLVVPPNLMDKLDKYYGDISGFELVNDAHAALVKSDFAFICSGTATLEAALIGTPFVLCYKARKIDIFIAKMLLGIKYVGLANIIFDFLGRPSLHSELIGDELSLKNLLNEYENCDKKRFLAASVELRKYLAHGSSARLAEMILR